MGPPGAGKGTQAARLAARLRIPHMASGDLFRDHQKRDTELGRLARSYMERGVLVPDEVTINMVKEWLGAPEQADGYLLDGFPRNHPQALALNEVIAGNGGLDKVLYINVDQEELVSRLGGRLVCRNCQATYHVKFSPPKEQGRCDACGGELYQRPDDSDEAVLTRLQVYAEATEPLVDYYQKAGKLVEINGAGPIEDVESRLWQAVEGRA